MVLAGEARSAYLARRFLAQTLDLWGAPGYADTAALVLSELVANAALHAKTEICVRVHLDSQGLRLEVSDGSSRRPMPRHYSAEATTGRGLGLVGALTQRWGVEGDGEGKIVWAELVSDREPAQLSPQDEVDLSSFPDLDDVAADPSTESGPSAWGRITTLRAAA